VVLTFAANGRENLLRLLLIGVAETNGTVRKSRDKSDEEGNIVIGGVRQGSLRENKRMKYS
jgi:hypothetical protein